MEPPSKNRYARQIRFAAWGEKGQFHFTSSQAVIVGCGALGTVQAEALARAGIGKLTLIDRDFVEQSNLHRQLLYSERDAEMALPKAVAAAQRLREVNSVVEVVSTVADLDAANIQDLLEGADLILDGTDNWETRYLINDFALASGTPWIYGAAIGAYGITMTVLPRDTACLRCVYPEPPTGAQPTCETAGVLATATMTIGTLQAAEAMKILSGNQVAVRRTILSADLWTGHIREIGPPERDPSCPACAREEWQWLDGEHRAPISLCGRNAVQIHERRRPLNLRDLRTRLAMLGEVRSNEFALRFFTDPYEMTIFPDGRAIVKGTTDPAMARSLYSRYIGN